MEHNRPDNHDDLTENEPVNGETSLLPGYAMGILTAEEQAEVERLLTKRPELKAELADYRAITQSWLMSVPEMPPPAGSLESLLHTIATTERPLTAGERVRRTLLTPSLRLSPALAAAVLAVLLGAILYLTSQVTTLRGLYQQAVTSADYQNIALTVMRAQDVRWAKMENPEAPEASEPYAWLVYSPGQRSGVILTGDFPPLPPDMAYQLWVSNDQERESLGLFRVEPNGSGSYVFRLPEAITEYDRMGITPEPAEGSPGPTGPAVVRLDLERFRT